MIVERRNIRNIAIIAHVDHGKTTLVDGLLRQARVFRDHQHVQERVLDSIDLERERGITIMAKNTAVTIPNPATGVLVKINIVDTPGHADFGGEVERVMNMVDGVLLLVDAAEGPMPQTRFVLKQALEMGHQAIVVINKMDRKDADPVGTLNKTFDLFIELGASEQQADFKVIYTNAVAQQSGESDLLAEDLQPLFSAILQHIPGPKVDIDAPLQMLVTSLGYDDFRGITAIGRIHAGSIRSGQSLARITHSGQVLSERARYLFTFQGLQRTEVEEAQAGDIVVIAGLEGIEIGETLADPEFPAALPQIHVEEPTVRMTFGVNTSPFAGREGKWGTSRKLRERLFSELRNNVSLRVTETENTETFIVSGRGELHLAILIETMRREGYEFQVSRPEAIMKTGENGQLLEPFEEVHIETSADTLGTIVEMLGQRKGQMMDLSNNPDNTVHLTYLIPTRGLLGFRYQFLTSTHGMGVMNTIFSGYRASVGAIPSRSSSSIVAWEDGITTNYGLKNAEERGILFYSPGMDVYEGMVVGETQRPSDLVVNVCKKKHLTNMRNSTRDIEVRLTPPRVMSIDEALEYLADDELLEVTPENFRIRKRILDSEERGKQTKRARELIENSAAS